MKRLVICCDGTWQRLYGDSLTNVALTARAVAPRDAQGQSADRLLFRRRRRFARSGLSLWQGMTGGDLDDNLLEAWLFINLNYEPGDQIYLFGFSRGAYTVRSLAGLLRKIGVLRRAHVDKARDALDLYRDARVRRRQPGDRALPHRARDRVAAAGARRSRRRRSICAFAISGVWDTVGSLGIPRAAADLDRA